MGVARQGGRGWTGQLHVTRQGGQAWPDTVGVARQGGHGQTWVGVAGRVDGGDQTTRVGVAQRVEWVWLDRWAWPGGWT